MELNRATCLSIHALWFLPHVSVASEYHTIPIRIQWMRPLLPHALATPEQQRLVAWTSKAYTDDNLFFTLARSPGVLEMFLHWAAFMYTGISRLDAAPMALCRLRLAVRNQGYPRLGSPSKAASNALASWRSAVSKPSVNQP